MNVHEEHERQNRKIVDLLSQLGTLGGEESPFNGADLCNGSALFPEEEMGEELSEETKKTRSKYLILKDFLFTKKLEGCSNNTIKLYYDNLFPFIIQSNKYLGDITTTDIRSYLNRYHETHEISNYTMDNMRRIFSSFFAWLHDEEYVQNNPMKKIKRIKSAQTIKKSFSDEELERIRDACDNLRDLVIVELLTSSGIRVSELCMLDKADINMEKREGIVYGKGDKERIIYFDARTKLHLKQYLARRIDDDPSLIVSNRYPYKRLQRAGVEALLRDIGIKCGVEHVHPHRFRRTFATNMIYRGVPIEQVQKMLGHTKIDTTLIYAIVSQSNVKASHEKFV